MKHQYNVSELFTSSDHVWTSENFQNFIFSEYTPTQSSAVIKQSQTHDLSTGRVKELLLQPESVVFSDLDAFVELLAELIWNQIDGKTGLLLNDSSANTFFVRSKDGRLYSVLVRRESAQNLWRCGAYLQKNLQLPDIRIFTPEQVTGN